MGSYYHCPSVFIIIITLNYFSSSLSSKDSDPGHPLHYRTSNHKKYLFDLITDPLENENLVNVTVYREKLIEFEDRHIYWQSQANDNLAPDETKREETWDTIGGIGPWIESDYTPLTVSSIYGADNAPHIVFVMIDDWGYNDVGSRSTYLSWTTPTFDYLSTQSILLENYYTYEICAPARAALLTGRYALRYGMTYLGTELPLNEITLAQELKSAGYMTYLIGKWHLGTSTLQHLPTNRGFDYFYGFLSGEENYYTKKEFEYYGKEYLDLRENQDLVTDQDALSPNLHSAYLFQSKAESVIENHMNKYPSSPMFLYYSMQLIHMPWTAPEEYLNRCEYPDTIEDTTKADEARAYCAMNIMMDEALANLTCVLNKYNVNDNIVMVIAGDNGGTPSLSGNSFPFRGHKGSLYRGGTSNTALIYSSHIPNSRKGTKYHGQVHVTDWLPTLMRIATGGQWTGSYGGYQIDGEDVWHAVINDEPSPHEEIIFYVSNETVVIQQNMLKYVYGFEPADVDAPEYVWDDDLDAKSSRMKCVVTEIGDNQGGTNQDDIRRKPVKIHKIVIRKDTNTHIWSIFVLSIWRLTELAMFVLAIALVVTIAQNIYRQSKTMSNQRNFTYNLQIDEESFLLTQENHIKRIYN